MRLSHHTSQKSLTLIFPPSWQKQTLDVLGELVAAEFSSANFEQTLFNLFNLGNLPALPAGAITALAYHLPAQQGWWLRADPVEIIVNASNAYLAGNNHLQLTTNEIASLQLLLNGLLTTDGMQLHLLDAQHGCLQLQEEPKIMTPNFSHALGKAISADFLAGEEYKKWQTLLTEIQMLLYSSSVNRERAARQQPLVSSLWLWGAGALPTIPPLPRWQCVWSSQALIKGLALFTNTLLTESTPDFKQCCAAINTPGEYLIDLSEIVEEEINQCWLNPVQQALRAGELAKVNICLIDGGFYNFTERRQPVWWRRIFRFNKD